MSSQPPIPVRALDYDSESPYDPWFGVLRGIGWVLVIGGIVQAVGTGFPLYASFIGWADPFYRRAGGYDRLPSPDLLAISSVIGLIAGITIVIAGFGCIFRKKWGRVLLFIGSLLQTIWRIMSYVPWIGYYLTMPIKRLELTTLMVNQVAEALITLALPVILFLIAKNKRLWSNQI